MADTLPIACLQTEPVIGDVLIGADGLHSSLRSAFYPDEGPPVFHWINVWRVVTPHGVENDLARQFGLMLRLTSHDVGQLCSTCTTSRPL